MNQRDRTKQRRRLVRIWTNILALADSCITEDRRTGKIDPEALKVRRSIMRRISRLKRLINAPKSRLAGNGLPGLDNRPHNGVKRRAFNVL